MIDLKAGLLVMACSLGAARAGAQQPQPDGFLPSAGFEASFLKYVPPTGPFSRLYSWDAHMALNLTVVRDGANAVAFHSIFETAGTENLGSKVGVGGTAYVLGLEYRHDVAKDSRPHITLTGGFSHLSSHLTRDLDAELDEIRSEGGTVPAVDDPDQYNVLYAGGEGVWAHVLFQPHLTVLLIPVHFTFNGDDAGRLRPLHIRSEWTLKQTRRARLIAATLHEIGPNPLNELSLELGVARRGDREPLWVFVSAAPGHDMHVSPIVGGVRDGVSLGFLLRFRG